MGSVSSVGIMNTLATILAVGLFQMTQAQSGCPEPYGIQTYPHEGYCDKFYKCTNGTLTEETCENGLVYDGVGDINNFCKCAKGVAYETPCFRGLAYSATKHVCDYPANVEYCESEGVVGFKCPLNNELPPNAVARRFLPFPRFPDPSDEAGYIVCVNNEPRIQHCGDGAVFDPQTLTCLYFDDADLAPAPVPVAVPLGVRPLPQRVSPFGFGK